MDTFAYASLIIFGLLVAVWLGGWLWALIRDLGLSILLPLAVAVVVLCAAVSAVWLIGTKVI